LKNGKEVNAVMLVGRLFHARATFTRNDRSPMVLSRVHRTIRRGQEQYNEHNIMNNDIMNRQHAVSADTN